MSVDLALSLIPAAFCAAVVVSVALLGERGSHIRR